MYNDYFFSIIRISKKFKLCSLLYFKQSNISTAEILLLIDINLGSNQTKRMKFSLYLKLMRIIIYVRRLVSLGLDLGTTPIIF